MWRYYNGIRGADLIMYSCNPRHYTNILPSSLETSTSPVVLRCVVQTPTKTLSPHYCSFDAPTPRTRRSSTDDHHLLLQTYFFNIMPGSLAPCDRDDARVPSNLKMTKEYRNIKWNIIVTRLYNMYYKTHMTYYRLHVNAYSICRRDYIFYYLRRTGWNLIPMRLVHYVYSAATDSTQSSLCHNYYYFLFV